MKIEPAFPTVALKNLRSVSSQTRPQLHNNTLTDIADSHSLDVSLAATPEVRAAKVARGKALIADPNYPSAQHIKKIARVLAGSGLGR